MEEKTKFKQPTLSIVLYVVAILIAIYSIYTIYTSYTYISGLVQAGSIVVSKQLSQVISYYISTSMPYVFYAIVVWAMGYFVDKVNQILKIVKNEDVE
ncbi:hypothetical protein [Terrisporobacter sp.]